ncbi:MAG: hypothetical protein K2G52_05385 [Muribaculaceae bacterium]|nr:hypothetical protein [Muribaculaceae bacterium]
MNSQVLPSPSPRTTVRKVIDEPFYRNTVAGFFYRRGQHDTRPDKH